MQGCCSQEDCEFASETYINILKHYIPTLPWTLLDLKVQNVVCSANTGFLIDLVRLQNDFSAAVNLDLRLFPGACFRLKNLPRLVQLRNGKCIHNSGRTTVVNVFRTGMVVVTGSKSVEMARDDFDWLVRSILHLYRDTEMDVRSSSQYRQLVEDLRAEETLAASEMLTDTSSVMKNFDADLYSRVQARNTNNHCSTFKPTTQSGF